MKCFLIQDQETMHLLNNNEKNGEYTSLRNKEDAWNASYREKREEKS